MGFVFNPEEDRVTAEACFAHQAGLHCQRRKQWLIYLSVILFRAILSYDSFPFSAPDEIEKARP